MTENDIKQLFKTQFTGFGCLDIVFCCTTSEELDCDAGSACPGNYGKWSVWSTSPCSVTCGQGVTWKKRICTPPKGHCSGSATSSTTCKNRPCEGSMKPQWSEWSAWTDCSRTCGTGLQTRSRQCLGEGNISLKCDGDYRKSGQMKEDGACNTQGCRFQPDPSGERWSDWGPWSYCDATCGTGKSHRFRYCKSYYGTYGYGCQGVSSEKQDCQSSSCPGQHGQWSQWTASKCSVTCGRGATWKTRYCPQYGQCPGTSAKTASCNKKPCFGEGIGEDSRSGGGGGGDSQWGVWSSWSGCSKTCGNGVTSRKRQCLKYGTISLSCDGDYSMTGTDSSSEPCNTQGCTFQPNPSGGAAAWGLWSEWSSCTETCKGGNRKRSRKCNIGGRVVKGCPNDPSGEGLDTLYGLCNTQNCDPSGGPEWSRWSVWGHCSVRCGVGQRFRRKICQHNGVGPVSGCPNDVKWNGMKTEHGTCYSGSCSSPYKPDSSAYWLPWSSWSSCSQTCGNGAWKRTRECSNKGRSPALGCKDDRKRNGQQVDYEFCNTDTSCGGSETAFSAKEQQVWSEWGQWSACTESCGLRGIRKRAKVCHQRHGRQYKCTQGITEKFDYAKCGAAHCSQEQAEWTAWKSWSTCSKTCGSGEQVRFRECKGPMMNPQCRHEGPGSSERRACNTKECCYEVHPPYSYSPSNYCPKGRFARNTMEWSSCTASCDGLRYRRMYCKNFQCTFETERCNIRCQTTMVAKGPNMLDSQLADVHGLLCEKKQANSWYFGDFNGDKLTDTLCSDSHQIFKLSHGGQTGIPIKLSWQGTMIGCTGNAKYVADFNGDGKDDLLCRDENVKTLVIKLATNQGIFDEHKTNIGKFCTNVSDELSTEDIDKDGKADILCKFAANNGEAVLHPFKQNDLN